MYQGGRGVKIPPPLDFFSNLEKAGYKLGEQKNDTKKERQQLKPYMAASVSLSYVPFHSSCADRRRARGSKYSCYAGLGPGNWGHRAYTKRDR